LASKFVADGHDVDVAPLSGQTDPVRVQLPTDRKPRNRRWIRIRSICLAWRKINCFVAMTTTHPHTHSY